MSNLEPNQLRTASYGPILLSVREPLQLAGFDVAQLQVDLANTQNGSYRFESYLSGSANLALLELPPGVVTEANLLIGPSDERKASFSFKVHTFVREAMQTRVIWQQL
jgi:hypothetical protein